MNRQVNERINECQWIGRKERTQIEENIEEMSRRKVRRGQRRGKEDNKLYKGRQWIKNGRRDGWEGVRAEN